ncbi:hypothetical protein FRB95_007322 [Tulasnella sp. JGI-2019a]|nr:hypothetical protein FRB95_007322 [Tulasnella sp. JGI-2019a]
MLLSAVLPFLAFVPSALCAPLSVVAGPADVNAMISHPPHSDPGLALIDDDLTYPEITEELNKIANMRGGNPSSDVDLPIQRKPVVLRGSALPNGSYVHALDTTQQSSDDPIDHNTASIGTEDEGTALENDDSTSSNTAKFARSAYGMNPPHIHTRSRTEPSTSDAALLTITNDKVRRPNQANTKSHTHMPHTKGNDGRDSLAKRSAPFGYIHIPVSQTNSGFRSDFDEDEDEDEKPKVFDSDVFKRPHTHLPGNG